MKIVCLTLAVMLASSTAVSADATADRLHLCKRYGEAAVTILKGRQAGMSLAESMSYTGGSSNLEQLVRLAYAKELHGNSEAVQSYQQEQFRMDIYNDCVEGVLNSK